MSQLSLSMRRILALVLLMAVVSFLWQTVVAPTAIELSSYRALVDQNRQLLSGYLSHAASRPQIRTRLVELEKIEATRGGFLTGATDAASAAALQDLVKRAIVTNGGKIKSSQILPPKRKVNKARIPVRFIFSSDSKSLSSIFHRIEFSKPHLFFDGVEIEFVGQRPERTSRSSQPSGGQEDHLEVRVTVYGYAKGAGQ